MDPFTQNILDRAEKRAAALGITNTSKFPLSEFNYDTVVTAPSVSKPPSKKSPLCEKSYTKPKEKNCNISTTTPENLSLKPQVFIGGSKVTKIETQRNPTSSKDVDVAVEINITTGSNVQVEVEVAECEVDGDGKVSRKMENKADNTDVKGLIRDSSRNQLQRLGTLYSESQDLSSPVHRTEGRFHEENVHGKENSRPRPKLAKLAMLADSINNWEDDTSHPDIKHHRDTLTVARKDKSPNRRQSPNKQSPKYTGATPKKNTAPVSPKSILSPAKSSGADSDRITTKTLKWDQKVMDALESQGFQRRESTTSKLVYDYKDMSKQSQEKQETEQTEKALVPIKKSHVFNITNSSRERTPGQEIIKAPTKKAEISKGMVSGRAAMFEKSNPRQSILKNNKDPAEMSLKERLAIFEKNKGQALVPKSPFGIAPSIKQIAGDFSLSGTKHVTPCLPIQGTGIGIVPKEQSVSQKQKIDTYNKPASAASTATGSAIKNTFAALMSNNSTLSESQILEETRRQRQQEMEMLLNRFSKPTDMSSDELIGKPVPSPPPMPPDGYLTLSNKKMSSQGDAVGSGNKRRSGEEHVSPGVRSTLDDVKRIRIVEPKNGRLYPTLSDIETTTTESEGDDYTTATVSGGECSDRNQDSQYQDCFGEEEQEYDDDGQYGQSADEDDSFMYSDEEDPDTGICDVSLGQEIMQAVKMQERRVSCGGRRKSQATKIDQHQQQSSTEHRQSVCTSHQSENSSTSEISGILDDMDDYLDEALDEENGEEFDTPRKSSVSSSSFSYQKNPRKTDCQTIAEEESEEKKDPQKPSPKQHRHHEIAHEDYSSPVKSELKINPSDDNNMVTLVHTVSFYRRQQSSNNPTPVKKIIRTPAQQQRVAVETTTEDSDDATSTTTATSTNSSNENDYLVQEKVKKLLDEVCKQQTVIAQTSQALNLCAATIEFSGSSESVEGERHLLVATHRRQAILDEVQRLRVEGCLRPPGAPTEKGRLTVKDITLPLKQEYIRKLASDSISGHHLVCLLKYNETVLATQTIPTLPGLLSVRFPDVLQLSNVFADFKITMEIYGMTAQREILPHEIKYHIAMNKKGSNKLHTPKGVKSNTRLIMPPVQSPAGPQAVRSPALVQYGFIIFSLKEIQRTNWTLNPVAGVSPLEGTVHMKVNCELTVTVDYRGFLTMFEDVSGFGAWHRRWCRLHGHVLRYWTYPDDEKRKPPIGSIDLQNCCTQQVAIAPRLVCSRLNTLLLEFRRPAQPDDVESLVLEKHGDTVIQRHLLSADSKEERDEWCAHLNKTLALLKAWGQTESRSTSC